MEIFVCIGNTITEKADKQAQNDAEITCQDKFIVFLNRQDKCCSGLTQKSPHAKTTFDGTSFLRIVKFAAIRINYVAKGFYCTA